jgi:hypothetical protein
MEKRLGEDARAKLAERVRTPEGADIMEDALLMAARALTEERRQAIANLLVTSLTAEEVLHAEAKKLLQLLNELQDPEIIVLRYFYLLTEGDQRAQDFYNLHQAVLEPETGAAGSPAEESDRDAIRDAYKASIRRLGLTLPRSDTQLNWLGLMLARSIGLD